MKVHNQHEISMRLHNIGRYVTITECHWINRVPHPYWWWWLHGQHTNGLFILKYFTQKIVSFLTLKPYCSGTNSTTRKNRYQSTVYSHRCDISKCFYHFLSIYHIRKTFPWLTFFSINVLYARDCSHVVFTLPELPLWTELHCKLQCYIKVPVK